jgi:hypothetical protein
MLRILTAASLLALGALVTAGGRAGAHTEPDYVAVPAGEAATISLKPTHGCGESPTTTVRVRAPLPEAVAEEVDGWSATTTPDGQGHTVLEWTGGVLPADEEGAFPVEFTAPNAPGDLLTFPSVQRCENGEELAWLSGDPADEYPAPRVLILPPGFEPALTLADVPPDVPGREKLVAIIDVDNPNAPPTNVPPPTTEATTSTAAATTTNAAPTTTASPTTAAPTTAAPTTSHAPTTTGAPTTTAAASTVPPTTAEEDDGGSSTGPIIGVLIGAGIAVAIAAGLWLKRHNASAT